MEIIISLSNENGVGEGRLSFKKDRPFCKFSYRILLLLKK